MLKGTTTIELTDVRTGEKQVVRESNMITNAVSRLFQPTLGHLTNEQLLRDTIPSYKTMLGGILLFDTPIPEDPNTIYAPAGPSLTGCARYNTVNTSTGLVLGSYNTTESEFNETEKRMKFVYDFNTSQGNGTIASICLTSVESGYGTYGSDMSYATNAMKQLHIVPKWLTIGDKDNYTGITTGSYYHLFAIDSVNDVGYYLTLSTANTITIQKRRLGLKNYSLFTNALTVIETSDTITLNTAIGSYRTYHYDRDSNSLYIISTDSSSIAVNGTFYVTQINVETYATTQYAMTNTTNVVLYGSSRFAIVHHGYVYVRSNAANYRVYKIELGNSANVTQLSGTSSYSIQPVFAVNGRTYWQYYASSNCRVYVTDEAINKLAFSGNQYLVGVTYSPSYSTNYYVPSYIPVMNDEMLYYVVCTSYSNKGFYHLTDYLATINNLSEPVVKTADKTMKVTYTIEEQ